MITLMSIGFVIVTLLIIFFIALVFHYDKKTGIRLLLITIAHFVITRYGWEIHDLIKSIIT